MENCCHICTGTHAPNLFMLDKIQEWVVSRISFSYFSFVYNYFHSRCSSELSKLIPPLKTFIRNIVSALLSD